MSLEQALKEITEALNRFSALLEKLQPGVISVNNIPEVAKQAIASAFQETAPVETIAEPVADEQSTQARDELQDAEQTDAPAYTADDVKSALMQVAKKSRTELQNILAHFKVANVSAIQAKDYAAVIAMAEQALEIANV
ncbi:hypothetical protein ABEF79_05935 [Acinetobacter sp. ANC 7454]|uniref:hypothetical protein n=1 Tax=Acinetobacter thermotolerans TaxID=3151487 RepID=UPI00325BD22C